eukprot:TRINITY_DN8993_c0_g1_i1.p1 TRINITY_DN8993_c0_g1~~TRINITY_DN8993_c0_g1_i1.p1  ORF type:complete len:100 (-),score=19.41 TRINITY_DN8993_c0_g1_i1:116-415(-)
MASHSSAVSCTNLHTVHEDQRRQQHVSFGARKGIRLERCWTSFEDGPSFVQNSDDIFLTLVKNTCFLERNRWVSLHIVQRLVFSKALQMYLIAMGIHDS